MPGLPVVTERVATGPYEIAFKPPRPASVTAALALMLVVIIAPAALGSFHWHWQKSDPTDYPAAGEDIGMILLVLLMVLNAAIILPLAGLIWAGSGWPRYVYLVLSLLGLPCIAAFLALGPVSSLCVFLASIGSIVLLFLPASNRWFQST